MDLSLVLRRGWSRLVVSSLVGAVMATSLVVVVAVPAAAEEFPGWLPYVDAGNGAVPPLVPEALPAPGAITYPSTYKNGMICRSSISNPGKPFLEMSAGAVVWTRCYVQKPVNNTPTTTHSGYSIVDWPELGTIGAWGGGTGSGALTCANGPGNDQSVGRIEQKCTVGSGTYDGVDKRTLHSYAADGYAVKDNRVRVVTTAQYNLGTPGSIRSSVGGGGDPQHVVNPPHPWNEAYWFDSTVQPPPWPDWWPAGTTTLGSTDANPSWPTDPGTGSVPSRDQLIGANEALRNLELQKQCECDPVDMYTGNLHFPVPSVSVPGRGAGLVVEAGYNSLVAGLPGSDTGAGHGWSTTLGMQLQSPFTSNHKVVVQESGATVTFAPDGSGWKAPDRFDATLEADGTGFKFTRAHRDVFRFDSTGRLISLGDRFGNQTTLTYPSSTSRQASAMTDPGGRSLAITWTGGRIDTITEPQITGQPAARYADFDYDANGDLVTYRDVTGGVWSFTYEAGHRMKTMRKPLNQPTGPVVENHYDGKGRVDWQKDELGRQTSMAYEDSATGGTKVTLPGGRVRVHRYNGTRREETIDGYGTDNVSTKIHFNPTTYAVEWTEDPGGNRTTFTDSNSDGNPEAIEDPTGRITRLTYDGFGQVKETRTGEFRTGPTTTSTSDVVVSRNDYDTGNGRLEQTTVAVGTTDESVTDYVYGDTGHPEDVTQVVDGRSKTWKFAYAAGTGYQTSAEDPLGNKSVTTFNEVGWPKTETSPLGVASVSPVDDYQTDYAYDTVNRTTTITGPAKPGQPRDVSRMVLDASGNVRSTASGITSSKPTGDVTSYDYTAAGEPWKVTAPGGAFKEYHYRSDGLRDWYRNELGAQTDYGYDAAGRPTSITDPNGKVTNYGYDSDGRLGTTQHAGTGASCTGTKVLCTTYTYDDAGRPKTIDYSDSTPDVTAINYDRLGRRVDATSSGVTETWTWNKRSELTGHTDANGDATGYQWDGTGNLTHITYPGGVGTVEQKFDAAGRMESVTDFAGRLTTFAHDADSNWTDSAFPGTSGTVNTDSYTYDGTGRMTAATWKQGSTVLGAETYTRPAATKGMVERLTPTGSAGTTSKTNTYDARDRLTASGSESFSIDDAGNLTKGPAGQRQVFDPAQQLCWTSATATSGTCATPAADATIYTYDDRGNRTTSQPAQGSGSAFSYDLANRLTAATVPSEESGDGQLVTFGVSRMLDTRSTTGGVCNPSACSRLAASTAKTFTLAAQGPIPSSGVSAVWATVTVISPSAAGNLKVNGGATAAAVTLNYESGVNRNATAIVPLVDGKITLEATTAVDVVLDVTGYFKTAGSPTDSYKASSPSRLVDTRNGTGTCSGSPCALTTANATTQVTAAGQAGIPATGAHAAVISLTAITPAASGQLKVALGWGGGGAATINYTAGETLNETVIAPIDANGKIAITSSTAIHFVIDVSGYFTAPAPTALGLGYHTITPARLVTVASGSSSGPCVGAACGPLVASTRQKVQVAGNAGVPASASAVVGYLTLSAPAADGFVRLNPNFTTGMGLAADETVNMNNGDIRNSLVLIPLKADGSMEIVSSVAVSEWSLDVSGYLTQPTGTTTYAYGIDGIRTKKTNPQGAATTFTYSDGAGLPLLLRQKTGTSSIYLIYGPGGQPIEQINPDGTATWLHHDQLGSVRLATKASDGTTQSTRRFNAYGTTATQTVTTTGDKQPLLGYAGQYTDTETGFQYLRARYFDTGGGQFLSRDPLEQVTYESYSYASLNPVLLRDDTGQFGHIALAAGIGGFVGGIAGGAKHLATNGFSDPRGFVASVAGGAVNGAVTSGCVAATGQVVACGAIGGVAGGLVEGYGSGEGYSARDAAIDFAIGGVSGKVADYWSPWPIPKNQFPPRNFSNIFRPGPIATKMYLNEILSTGVNSATEACLSLELAWIDQVRNG